MVFDSKAEKRVFQRLNSSWKGRVEVYPNLSVRRVLGYEALCQLPLSNRAKEYLLKTDFDFTVCERGSSRQFLIVEFDGIGHGFSKDSRYVSRVVPINDPHRSLKLNTKLDACEHLGIPLVIVSFEETESLSGSDGKLTVLDAVIGEVLSSIEYLII